MIKEGYNEKLIFKPIQMNKKILRNFEYLQNLSRRAKGEARVKADRLIDLYKSRQISQLQTAENAIFSLISQEPKNLKKGMKLADQIIGKHAEVEPLSHRLREKTTVRVENQVVKGVNVGEEKKSKTDIKINLNSAERKDNKHALWEFVYKIAKPRITKVEKMLNVKKQMKIQMVVYYRIKKPAHEDDKLSDQEYRIDKNQAWKYKDVMDNTKADMVTSNNTSTVLAKQADNIQKQINNSNDSWQVDTFYYIVISCYTIEQPRAASYSNS